MRQLVLVPILALLTLSGGCAVAYPELDYRGVQQVESVMIVIDEREPIERQYLLYLPDDYELQDDWPMILFVHGAKERGDDIELLTRHGLPRAIEQGMSLPFVVASPQWPLEEAWEPEIVDVFIEEMLTAYDVDPDRIYLTGLSEGAFLTWDLAMAFPDRFAALAPIGGAGDPWSVDAIVDIPVWMFHILIDVKVPLRFAIRPIRVLERLGGDVRTTIYPAIGHGGWALAYDTPGLYDWFLTNSHNDGQEDAAE